MYQDSFKIFALKLL